MLSVRGAIQNLATAINHKIDSVRVNLIFPSRPSFDPRHDARLSRAALFLGSRESSGISGQIFNIFLPSHPQFNPTLSPEVQAALDENVRQGDLEAAITNINDLDETDNDTNQYSRTVRKTWLNTE
tara:strand:+ start:47 stop:424 length:378 start_codon:yes stop_codon:yes gene_type:complete